MSASSVKKKVLAELAKIKTKKGVYTFISKPEDYTAANIVIISTLTKRLRLAGIYVTLNKPCSAVSKELEREKINLKQLLFIDGTGEEKSKKISNCIYIQGNQSLTELSLAMTEAGRNKSTDFIFFDSLSTLLVYNSREITERFIHYIVNKGKSMNLFMVIISVEEERSNKLIPLLSQICDGCIKI